MSEIVFFLEEPSAQALLEGLLPRLLPQGQSIRYLVFEGKQDLEKQLARKLRGYRVPEAKFVILRDKDSGDCRKTKDELVAQCTLAGHPDALVRIACHELESWYLADLSAVEKALNLNGLARRQGSRLCAKPDSYPSPYQTLKKLAPSYQKVSGSREIGLHLDTGNTRSKSFSVFIAGLRKLCRTGL